ncbi:hypothetical protein E2P81_ATG01633 [Venturia nashicola]|uniref:Carboxylesterase family protein n=1 Tax=Venturia nashicola TaxID=86259 RepID=A0A4Z1P0J3_9PEZI|nr:hypothetical protein E6O75_ATG01674 [Venturia nashicola]TLD18905.1 hypothetical protein E2P81_ATG01633 [Venturia nashicola]
MAARKTRAAAKADEESTSPSTGFQDNPLNPKDKVLNQESDDDQEQVEESPDDMARPKSRKGGKNGAKRKATKKAKVTLTPETTPEVETVEPTPALIVEEDGFNPAAMPMLRSPKKDVEAESTVVEEPLAEDPTSKARPATPEAKLVRMTRRQLALAEAIPASVPTIEEPLNNHPEPEPVATVEEAILAVEAVEELATPAEEPSTALPQESEAAHKASPSVQSPAAFSNTPPLMETPTEHPIDALDALEDTLDEVDKIIPGLDLPASSTQAHPTRPKAAKAKTSESRSIKASSLSTLKPTAEKKELAAKKPLARSDSVKTKATPKIATTTQPSATSTLRASAAVPSNGTSSLARSNSVRTTKPLVKSSSTLGRSTSTKARPASMIAPETVTGPDTKKPEAAKHRPISVQFPTPPPATKSSKPPTQATFKLPGEDVAAKLKQAKEERLKRMEAKEAEKKEAKPRPTIRKPVPVKDKENVSGSGLKRSSTVTSTSTKRTSMVADRTKRTSMLGGTLGAGVSIPPPKRSSVAAENDQKAFSSSLSMPKQRTAAAGTTTLPAANTSAKRLSTMSSSTSLKSRNVSGATGSTNGNKGKEAFNRGEKTSDVLEREKREKDESMKKARADAAERGRQASRDWAEKERQKKAAAARRVSAAAVSAV